jgi:hypothetical protein
MFRRWIAALFGGLLLGLAGCTQGQPGSAPAGPAADAAHSPSEPLSDERFHERLLTIAQNYKSFGRVDDKMRWAPLDCAAPGPPELSVSASTDADTHGRKLYAVFAFFKEDDGYIKGGQPSPVNQEIVKESWVPEEVKDDGRPLPPTSRPVEQIAPGFSIGQPKPPAVEVYLPYARKDGKLYHAAEQADLFIMFKMDPKTPGTDQGWVYGTVTPDGKQVTSAGRVESCMQCHVAAPHDRLFGRPKK